MNFHILNNSFKISALSSSRSSELELLQILKTAKKKSLTKILKKIAVEQRFLELNLITLRIVIY